MPQVIILDPNLLVSRLLKQALEAEGYNVTIIHAIEWADAPVRLPKADLVMISSICGQRSGWEIYRKLKEAGCKDALLVYVMDQWNLTTAKWVIEAVDEAMKSCKPNKWYNRHPRGVKKPCKHGETPVIIKDKKNQLHI